MDLINVFKKGMNKDLSLSLLSPEMYFDAQNMTLVTEQGQVTGSIQNTKGNLLSITLPSNLPGAIQDTSNVSEVVIDLNSSSGNVDFDITLQPTGITYSFSIAYGSSEEDFYINLADYINTTLVFFGLQAAYTNDHLVVWSTLDVGNQLINTDISIVATVTTGTGTVTINNTYVPAQTGCEWIGWGRIRDDFYLFSTNDTTQSPTTSYGQIWKFQYDKLTYYYRLTLIYNGQINFTNFHPIPNPGGFVGNYDTDNIQKIYWTDNYNRLRSVNTQDVNLFALDPDNIDVYPDIALSIPILQNIGTGGVLNKGIWQCAYRLKKDTGSTTTFSQCSNPVFLIGAPENSEMIFYQTDDPFVGNSGKTLTYQINNVDTSYSRIEVLALYRNVDGGVPRIMLIVEEPILTDTFTCTFTGNQPVVDITIDEYLADPLVFDTVKTIASKNNFLFAGNVKYSDFDVNFDAVTPRYDRNGNTYIDPVTNPNNINPDQDPGMVGSANDAFIYQSDGITIGGGDLTNGLISYEFTRPDFVNPSAGDQSIVIDNSYTGTVVPTAPFFEIFPNSNNEVVDLITTFGQYPNPYTYPDYHSPYICSSIKQYRRDELYRFGIVFFSKKGEPSYVHWIGDIKMPHTYMPQQNQALVTRVPLAPNYENYYPLTCGESSIIYGNPLGIKFTVNVDSIKDQISGYSIVRVKRENSDKSVLGQGILYPAHTDGADNYIINQNLTGVFNAGENVSPEMSSFNCPDFLFRGSPRQLNGDYFDYIGLLTNYCESSSTWCSGISVGNFKVLKYQLNDSFSGVRQIEFTGATLALYQPQITASAAVDLARAYDDLDAAGGGNVNMRPYFSGTTIPTVDVYNASKETVAGANVVPTLGSKTLLCNVDFTDASGAGIAAYESNVLGDNVVADSLIPVENQYLVNYKRNLTQYGGNTNAQKSKNEYISTGHYQPVDENYTGSTPGTYVYTGTVFGGDSYIAMFDNVKQFPRTKIGLDWDSSSQTTGECVHIYPVETDININLRYSTAGAVANKYQALVTFGPPYDSIDTVEEFLLRPFVDMQNDVRLYFPRPIPFIDGTEHDVRVFASQRKVSGEIVDSWGQFKEDDFIDVDSIQGPLNNLIVHKDRLLGYQDQGVVNLPVEERSLIQDSTGADLTLGTGGILPRYDYISKKIGSKHQFGFTQSADAVFFFDINSKSIYKQTDVDPQSISLIKGVSSYLRNNITGLLQVEDNPFRQVGITATYDFINNEAIFTFKDKQKNLNPGNIFSTTVVSFPSTNTFVVDFSPLIPFLVVGGEVIYEYIDPFSGQLISLLCTITALNAGYPIPPIQATLEAQGLAFLSAIPVDGTVYRLSFNPFTIAYNDFVDSFTNFYSFTPCMYVSDQLNYFSPSGTQDDLWIHKKGDYGKYYDTVFPSSVSFYTVPDFSKIKVWDNWELMSEVLDPNGFTINETFDTIKISNDYQNSDTRLMSNVAKFKETKWNISPIRNRVIYPLGGSPIDIDNVSLTDPQFAERLRSKFNLVELAYNNLNNNQLTLHTFNSVFRVSPR